MVRFLVFCLVTLYGVIKLTENNHNDYLIIQEKSLVAT